MRIIPATLVFLASSALISAGFIGLIDAYASDGGVKTQPRKTEPKPVDAKPDANAKVFIYKQTGGFIGVNRKYEQNLADLSSGDRHKLETLIADSGLASDARKGEIITSGACDMFQYDFTFKDGAKQHHVTYDDGTLPDSFRPLVQYCKDKVVDLPRR